MIKLYEIKEKILKYFPNEYITNDLNRIQRKEMKGGRRKQIDYFILIKFIQKLK